MFLQLAEILEKRRSHAGASALCKSRMNYDPSRHVVGPSLPP
jgi:hypothetical protein